MNKVIRLKGIKTKRRKAFKPKNKLNFNRAKDNISFKPMLPIISIFSVLIGCVLFTKSPIDFINQIIQNKLLVMQSNNFYNIFKSLILFEFLFVFLLFFLGTNIFGNFVVGIVPILKMITCGYLCSYMYNKFELNGVLFSLVFIVPFISISGTVIIALSSESYLLSKSVNTSILQRKTAKDGTLQLFLVKFIIIAFLEIILVLLNSAILSSFGSKISLQ